MVPSLPTELKLMIIEEALAGAPSQERQQTRQAIRRVSRAWRDSIDYWKEIEVIGLKQVEALKKKFKLKRSRASTLDQIGSIYIEVTGKKGKDKGAKVAGLIKLVPNATRVTVMTGRSILSTGSGYDSLGYTVHRALATLPNVTHFSVLGPPARQWETPYVHDDSLQKLVAAWPGLSSLDLTRGAVKARHFWRWGGHTALSVLQNGTRLTSFATSIPYSGGEYEDVLVNLPASLTRLAINGRAMLFHHNQVVVSLVAKVASQAPHLTAFSLLDTLAPGVGAGASPLATRGGYDGLVGAMASVEELAIGSCAVSSLATVLAPLGRLKELRVVQGATRPVGGVAHTELHGLITASSSLRKVTLARSIWTGWSAAEQTYVETAAELKSVALEQI